MCRAYTIRGLFAGLLAAGFVSSAFAQVPLLWKFHSVHHSTEDLEWISASRFHPVNLLMGTVLVDVLALLAGFSPDIFLIIGPFDTLKWSATVIALIYLVGLAVLPFAEETRGKSLPED